MRFGTLLEQIFGDFDDVFWETITLYSCSKIWSTKHFIKALLAQILGDFDDVVDSITQSGDHVDSAELEVFDVKENNGYVDFKLIFRFKVPQYKVRDP